MIFSHFCLYVNTLAYFLKTIAYGVRLDKLEGGLELSGFFVQPGLNAFAEVEVYDQSYCIGCRSRECQ